MGKKAKQVLSLKWAVPAVMAGSKGVLTYLTAIPKHFITANENWMRKFSRGNVCILQSGEPYLLENHTVPPFPSSTEISENAGPSWA